MVETTSSIVPGMKWASEYTKAKEHAKPIKFIENCSQENRKNDIFDQYRHDGHFTNKNEYIGLNCVCEEYNPEKPNQICNNLDHTKMLGDPYII